MEMKSTTMWTILVITMLLVVLGSLAFSALSAQDKYTVKVPNGLAFSEFRSYEDLQLVSISHNGEVYAAILANPVMIDAFQAGIPDNGKPFPDGAKMAKVHWAFEEPTFIYGANANGLLGKRSDIAARGLTKDIVVARLERKHEQLHRRVQIQ